MKKSNRINRPKTPQPRNAVFEKNSMLAKASPNSTLIVEILTVMSGIRGYQSLPDILRRLEGRGVTTTVGEILSAIRQDNEKFSVQNQRLRIGTSGDERLVVLVGSGQEKLQFDDSNKTSTTPQRRSEGKVLDVIEEGAQANEIVRTVEILESLLKLHPTDFEKLIERLLKAMGVREVKITPPTRDAGVDVRGILVIEDIIHIRIAVQVKRYAGNVSSPDIQKLRGSLSNGEVGWFFTTGGYSQGARVEAAATSRQPISLISGPEVVQLLEKYQVVTSSID